MPAITSNISAIYFGLKNAVLNSGPSLMKTCEEEVAFSLKLAYCNVCHHI